MYQHQISQLKQDIISRGGFEGCLVKNESFLGIQILGCRKLPTNINQGRHHIFCDLEDYRGNQYQGVVNNTLRYDFSKPSNEVGIQADIWSTGNSFQIVGKNNTFSQILDGISYSHTDWGHSSVLIYAVLTDKVIPPQPTESEAQKLIREIEERTKRLKELVK